MERGGRVRYGEREIPLEREREREVVWDAAQQAQIPY